MSEQNPILKHRVDKWSNISNNQYTPPVLASENYQNISNLNSISVNIFNTISQELFF